jgi:hypothetical protein
VHFEAPLTHRVLAWSHIRSLVFVDVDEASPEYPTGGTLRLLLQGSAHHLLGAMQGPAEAAEMRLNGSRWAEFAEVLRGSLVDGTDGDVNTPLRDRLVQNYAERMLHDVRDLTKSLQPGYTAAWMGGYARVTARMPNPERTVLAASPLYVEHIAPPDTIAYR